MKKFQIVAAIFSFFCAPLFAGMESEERLTLQEEELRLLQETYDFQINQTMAALNESDSSAFFNARAEGKYVTWKDFGIEMPALQAFTVKEVPYGYSVKTKWNARETVTILVFTRDDDLYYQVTIGKGASNDFTRMVKAIFESDGETTSREGTPCDSKAVSCLNGYEKGTHGKNK